ncbi:MAG TPA: DegT/DnrJ/EryC1/StrS family aminotransferase [Thermoanaerobaculia bacterium]
MIHHSPRAPLSLLLRRPSAAMDEALSLAPSRFHFSRDALHAWFAGHGTVWFPSFHCGMEVRAAVDAGCTPRFYRVRDDLRIDEADLAARLAREPGVVVVIHYFGFPQPAVRRIDAPLLEDCSHAFLSRLEGQPLGTFGDAATFSTYKTLGTVDGGALRGSCGAGFQATPRPRQTIALDAHLATWKRRRRDRAEADGDILRRRFDDRVRTARARIFEGPWQYGRGMSRLSLALTRRIDPRPVIERRRANYQRLAQLLGVDRHLDDGVVPLFLPYFVDDRSVDRTGALVRLQANGIEPFIFGMFFHPAMNESEFPEARRLRENLLCLPIHHDLRDRDLLRIAEVLR